MVTRATLVGTMSNTIRDVDIVGLLGYPPEKVRVVPASTPDDLGAPASRDTVLAAVPAAARPFLLYPAALRVYKNHARLIEALALVRRGGEPSMQLIFTGFGALPADLARLVTRLGLTGAVHAVGSVPRPVLASLYGAAAATVVPSLYEQGSFPVLEAIRCGCPATASDIPALQEAFAGFTDAVPLFDPKSPEAIADALLRVLADREAVRRRQQDAVAALPPRSWAAASRDWLEVLREAAGQRHDG